MLRERLRAMNGAVRGPLMFLTTTLTIAILHVPCYGQYGPFRGNVATGVQSRRAVLSRPVARPRLSPYLDLGQRGRGRRSSFQYFRRIRPELEIRRAFQINRAGIRQLGQTVRSTRRELQILSRPQVSSTGRLPPGTPRTTERRVSITGHSVSFLDLKGYFPALED